MCLFANKSKKNKERVGKLCGEFERLADLARDSKMFAESRKLSGLSDLLAERFESISLDELSTIEQYTKEINNNLNLDHSELVNRKINKINELLKGVEVALPEHSSALESNQDIIDELNIQLAEIEKQIDKTLDKKGEIESKIKNEQEAQQVALANKDEATWTKHYYRIENLKTNLSPISVQLNAYKNQLNVISHNITSYQTQNANIEMSYIVKKSAELSKKLDNQKNLVDIEMAKFNAEYSKSTADRIDDTNDKIQSIIGSNFENSDKDAIETHDFFEAAYRESLLTKNEEKKEKSSEKNEDKQK